jgi:hypothetical protein
MFLADDSGEDAIKFSMLLLSLNPILQLSDVMAITVKICLILGVFVRYLLHICWL